jgi:UDP-N-acetylglucosamine 2-epimerase (non-hydrolysing)
LNKRQRFQKEIDVSKKFLPIEITENLKAVFSQASSNGSPILSVVTGTKPDFYKQAPLALEAARQGMPVFVIDTGQHFDDLLGFGIEEFNLGQLVGCRLQIRGDLMEKAGELILKFGTLGRYCRKRFGPQSILPIVHGDTLVAGIASLAWVFGMGQKVAQNEAGLRSMSPIAIRKLRPAEQPTRARARDFIHSQFHGEWFLAREEPFPEQIDTWICSAGTQYFFAPVRLNKDNLVREGYPRESVHVVGNSVVDAIHMKRKKKPDRSIFELYPALERGEWVRIDIHRRENLTPRRFGAIVGAISDLVKNSEHRLVLVMLNATASALSQYGHESLLKRLAKTYPDKFVITPLWKEYAHVVEFLDSGHCWAELTDSGSMQEELLYFRKVLSLTVRLNTDRPETVFDAKSNVLLPPVNRHWLTSMVEEVHRKGSELGAELSKKKQLYGKPGQVSKKIVSILKKEFEGGEVNFYPWLHQRLGLWKENQVIGYL